MNFKERKHRWAIDTGDGTLMGLDFPWQVGPLDTALYRTKKEAQDDLKFWLNDLPTSARVMKVFVSYASDQTGLNENDSF